MKFYDCKTAPSPRRVRIFMAEKGIEIETVQVDLASGEQLQKDYRQINPDCVVPTLQLDDGTCISEVVAICQYLESQYPEPRLMGHDDVERAKILMWNAKVEQHGLWSVAHAFRNAAKGLKGRALPGPDPYEQIPELAERGRSQVEHFFARLDGQLADNRFVAGESLSIADITAVVVVEFAGWIKIAVPEQAENLQRWYESVSTRPSMRA